MFEYISGTLIELNPTYAIIENGGIAYFINISLNTYSQLTEKIEQKLYLHQVIREDAHLLFGFAEKSERDLFRLLITVSGIGANTARMMLSSLSSKDIRNAILTGNVNVLQGIKGIGLKTAQRLIIELKDKVVKAEPDGEIFVSGGNTRREEALSALVMLGFNKAAVEKNLDKIIQEEADLSVEALIKLALKRL
ncbi:MAG: Holliday junction branch migration protein RuvA [Bacteroidales bacterium]